MCREPDWTSSADDPALSHSPTLRQSLIRRSAGTPRALLAMQFLRVAAQLVQLACELDAGKRLVPRENRAPESVVTTARQHGRRHVGRRAVCALSVREPRSTAKGAGFTTSRGATLTYVAREVTLYLALTSPKSSPRS
jgi:hypothetical protein